MDSGPWLGAWASLSNGKWSNLSLVWKNNGEDDDNIYCISNASCSECYILTIFHPWHKSITASPASVYWTAGASLPLLNSQHNAGGRRATLVLCRDVNQGMKCAQELASGERWGGSPELPASKAPPLPPTPYAFPLHARTSGWPLTCRREFRAEWLGSSPVDWLCDSGWRERVSQVSAVYLHILNCNSLPASERLTIRKEFMTVIH